MRRGENGEGKRTITELIRIYMIGLIERRSYLPIEGMDGYMQLMYRHPPTYSTLEHILNAIFLHFQNLGFITRYQFCISPNQQQRRRRHQQQQQGGYIPRPKKLLPRHRFSQKFCTNQARSAALLSSKILSSFVILPALESPLSCSLPSTTMPSRPSI